jgi:hypothetical protein
MAQLRDTFELDAPESTFDHTKATEAQHLDFYKRKMLQ